jgi:hypothetical protein
MEIKDELGRSVASRQWTTTFFLLFQPKKIKISFHQNMTIDDEDAALFASLMTMKQQQQQHHDGFPSTDMICQESVIAVQRLTEDLDLMGSPLAFTPLPGQPVSTSPNTVPLSTPGSCYSSASSTVVSPVLQSSSSTLDFMLTSPAPGTFSSSDLMVMPTLSLAEVTPMTPATLMHMTSVKKSPALKPVVPVISGMSWPLKFVDYHGL